MAKAGGSATANGILYQVLGTLGRAVELTLQGTVEKDDLIAVTLVIEPIGGGGDLQILTGEQLEVEQWKSRSDQGTWSLKKVIDSVFPDLYLATEHDARVYRFRTEGRIGTWQAAYDFFRNLGEPPRNGNPADTLNDTVQRKFSTGLYLTELTERQLFMRVVEAVQLRQQTADETAQEVQRKVWRLLSRFKMSPLLSEADLVKQIDEQLQKLVDYIEDVEGKRHELCGHILRLAGQGGVRIQAETLIRRVGLTPHSFLAWKTLRKKLCDRLLKRLERAGYRADEDVRPAPSLASTAPIVVITGDSGQGKSWQLAALARRVAEGPSLVVWVPSERRDRSADDIAADEIWCIGLDHDQTLSLEKVAKRRERDNPSAPIPWGFICVDDVHSRNDASYLAQLPWEEWKLRLVISAPREVAAHLQLEYPEREFPNRVSQLEVTDFSPLQVRDYLTRRGRVWGDTPQDVRELIRRPILAKIYADIAESPNWSPRYEYELMEKYWCRIRHPHGEIHDYGLIRKLAVGVLDDQPIYPWTPELLDDSRVSTEALQRLKASGWLREVEDGLVECWHDRLLCWAVAESVRRRRCDNQMTTKEVSGLISSLQIRNDDWARRLGYVALDVLWLLTDPKVSADIRNDAWQLISALEVGADYLYEANPLYKKHLPTLGSRVIPAIVKRVEQAEDALRSPYPRLAGQTLLAIARREPEPVRQARRCLINCVLRFRDQEELHRLADWVRSRHEFIGSCALVTLACFDPKRAITLIEQVTVNRLMDVTGPLSDILMAFAPAPTCQVIRGLSAAYPEYAKVYFGILSGGVAPNAETVNAVIDWVENHLIEYLNTPDETDKDRSDNPLCYLDHLRGHIALETLRRRRGSRFEEQLAEAACRWADNTTGTVDHTFQSAKNILLKIGGEGLTRVINAQLAATSEQTQFTGCDHAVIRPNEETRQLLASLANNNKLWGIKNTPSPAVQQLAMESLAALGENTELIRAVLRWGWGTHVTHPSPDVAELRHGQPPMSDAEIAPALRVLGDPFHEQHTNSFLALGFSGRDDVRSRIQALFLKSQFESDVACTAMLALKCLNSRNTDLSGRLVSQYRSGYHKGAAVRLMATGDSQEAHRLFAAALPEHGPYDDLDQRIIRFLAMREETRPLIEKQLRELLNSESYFSFDFMVEKSKLLDPRDAQDGQQLWETAANPSGSMRISGIKAGAIERLATVQPDAAFDLASGSLLHDEHDRDKMPGIMLQIDADRALPDLLDYATETADTKTCRLIALQLREQMPQDKTAQAIEAKLHDHRWRVRRAMAYMAGFMGSEFLSLDLKRLVLSDGEMEVCCTAAHALRQQQGEAEAAVLVEDFADADGVEAWAMAQEIVHLADPKILASQTDPLGFRSALREKPFVLRRHLNKRLQNRDKEIKRDLELMMSQWKDQP